MIEDKKPATKRKLSSAPGEKAREDRLVYLEEHINEPLKELRAGNLTSKEVDGNIECFLGSIQVPVGLAGPIKFKHDDGSVEQIYAPVGTSEGALVASMSRGAYAIGLSGGFSATVIRQKMSRCPMFCFEDMSKAKAFCDWANQNFDRVKKETKKYSNHANLVSLEPQLFGRNVHLKFDFETGDASGQNMTTTCTWNSCIWIEENYNSNVSEEAKIKNFVIEANGSSDKKVSSRSRISTRGVRVISECHLPEKVVNRVLKTTSQEILDLYVKATAMAVNDGMIGYNVNVANTVAAFFASTGQDLACIHESSVAIMQVEKTDKGLYMAITMPSLVIGTIGGGTGLKGPKEVLKILGCNGNGKVERLAKIIAGFALGLELSTMSAITSGQFATSHERLGRNRPVEWLNEHEITLDFFKEHFNLNELEAVEKMDEVDVANGIVSEVTAKVSKKPIGFFPYKLTKNGRKVNSLLKLKPLDEEILLGFEIIAGLVSNDLKKSYQAWKQKNAFRNSHTKEIEAYKSLNQSHPHLIPKYFGAVQIPAREIYGISKELLDPKSLTHFNSENEPDLWKFEHKEKVLSAVSEIHGEYFETPGNFASQALNHLEKCELIPFYNEIVRQAETSLNWFGKEEANWFKKIIDNLPEWYQEYSALPKTFIHNDFSPRNICLRNNGTPVIYDWELCEISPPQRDFIEFMAFTQHGKFHPEDFESLSRIHYQGFTSSAELNLSFEKWQQGLLVSAYEFLVDRLSFYMIGNIINQYKFLKRVFFVTKEMIEYMEKEY